MSTPEDHIRQEEISRLIHVSGTLSNFKDGIISEETLRKRIDLMLDEVEFVVEKLRSEHPYPISKPDPN